MCYQIFPYHVYNSSPLFDYVICVRSLMSSLDCIVDRDILTVNRFVVWSFADDVICVAELIAGYTGRCS